MVNCRACIMFGNGVARAKSPPGKVFMQSAQRGARMLAMTATRQTWQERFFGFKLSLCFSFLLTCPMSLSREELRSLWLTAPPGRLSPWEQARALGLREASKLIFDGEVNKTWSTAGAQRGTFTQEDIAVGLGSHRLQEPVRRLRPNLDACAGGCATLQ